MVFEMIDNLVQKTGVKNKTQNTAERQLFEERGLSPGTSGCLMVTQVNAVFKKEKKRSSPGFTLLEPDGM